MSSERKVVVTGLGAVTPIGLGPESFWQANLEGRSGVRPIQAFDTTEHETRIAGEIQDFNPNALLDRNVAKRIDRFAQFALVAAGQALADAGLSEAQREAGGVFVGSGLGGMFFYEKQIEVVRAAGLRRAHPSSVPRIMPNAPAGEISVAFGMRGPNVTVSTACSSGGHSLGQARDAIQRGKADVCLAGGTESPLAFYTFGAFGALRVMSRRNEEPEKASRPFDRDRDGFVMGEGAGMLVLESEEHARKRGAKIYAELAGYGSSGSGYHMVMPQPDGEDAYHAMRLALADAGLNPDQIDYINAHGTATKQNDLAEAAAIQRLFGQHAPKLSISSTKSMIGHLIGAAGAVEAVVCCLALREGIVPPTINL
ncbi:MAG: beta-ketoacyl-ACP synthase II, partial [Verrucomicrobiae bacterium]|nr:beta-ketoacyl-ACP synthase II [Verrucomicrobiae bacterium]